VLAEIERDGRRAHETQFLKGPIFANVVLADEINRTPPKTQAALLQAMQEQHVTASGTSHALPIPFQVFATRNPIEQEGTYPLPEAQLDRFLLEIQVRYPSAAQEVEIARRTTSGQKPELVQVVERAEVERFQALVPRIPVSDEAVLLAVDIARRSRPDDPQAPQTVKDYVRFGAGPRGSRALVLEAKAHAALQGQPAADLDNVRAVAVSAMRHRLVLSYRAEADGVLADAILSDLLA
jgi:MoxR-like ATPase